MAIGITLGGPSATSGIAGFHTGSGVTGHARLVGTIIMRPGISATGASAERRSLSCVRESWCLPRKKES